MFRLLRKFIMSTAGKIVSVIITLAIAMSLVLTVSKVAFAGNDTDASFYNTAAVAGSFYDSAADLAGDNYRFQKTPDKGAAVNAMLSDPSQMANVGAFMGYVDKDYPIWDFTNNIAQTTMGTQSRSYTVSPDNQAVAAYLQYGHALQALGLDTVSSNQMDFMGIGRMFLGYLSMSVYVGALVPQVAFSITINIMQTLNPFNWMVSEAIGGGETAPALAGVKGFVTDLYNVFAGMGLYVATLLLAVGIGMSILFWRKSNNMGSHFKKFVIRLLFIAAGLPFLGMTYTAALNNAADSFATSAPMANKAVAATFVDFAAWAEKNNLALPEGTTIKVNDNGSGSGSGTIDMGGTTAPQTFALKINTTSGSLVDGDDVDASNLTNNLTSSHYSGTGQLGKALEVFDLLNRFANSTRYTAGAYETYVKTISGGRMAEGLKVTSNKDKYTAVDNILSPDADASKLDNKDVSYMSDGTPSTFGVTMFGGNIIYTGHGKMSKYSPGSFYRKFENKASSLYKKRLGSRANAFGGATSSGTGGLSTISMYNYLTTKFADDTVTNYSSTKLASDYVLDTHHSVSLVGGGVMGIVYWLNMVSILSFIAVVGTVYAFGLIGGSVKRGIKMVTSIPFAAVGSVRAISKIVGITVSMIVQIYGTLIVYNLVVELFIASQQIFLTPLLTGFNNGNVSAAIIPGMTADYNGVTAAVTGLTVPIVAFIMSIVNIVITIKAVKLRKTLVKSMDEAMAGWVDRFFNSDSARNNLNSRSLGDVVREGVSAGAGMAAAGAANRFVNGTRNPSQAKGVGDDGVIGQKGDTGLDGIDGSTTAPDNVTVNGGSIESHSNMTDIDNVHSTDVARGAALASTAGSIAEATRQKGKGAEQKMSRQEKNELKEKAKLASASGQTTHLQDEEIERNKKKAQKEAALEGLKGAANAGMGGARMLAGDVGGGAAQVASGLKGIHSGLKANGEAEVNAAQTTTSQSQANKQNTENRRVHVQTSETTKGSSQEKGPSSAAKKAAGELTVEIAKKKLGGM
jgi:hypothetical membrane protein